MVAKFKSHKNIYETQKYWSTVRRIPWLTLGIGMVIIFLIYWNLVGPVVKNNNATDLGIKYENYNYLYKIYKEFPTSNFTQEADIIREIPPDSPGASFRIACYYVVSYNSSRSKVLQPNSVDPYLCTHLIVGFAIIENATIYPRKPSEEEVYKVIVNLKKANPSLKVLLSVQDSSSKGEFAFAVSSDSLRKTFALNALTYIITTGFDGIDIDWEFPSWPDADLLQTRNFTLLLGEIRQLINSISKFKNCLVSVAVASPELIMRQSYEIKEMGKFVDFVNLMSYDYHMFNQYSPLTGPNAPLYRRNADYGFMETLNTNWSATHWISWGMPRYKINVGIPTYGHSFRLVNENNNGWNAPAAGYGRTGGGNGFFVYPDACEFINDPSTTHVFDDEYDVPYAYNGDEWLSYDNIISVQLKAMYIKDNIFGGAMIYCLNCDDFEGVCSSQLFSLTRTVSNILTGYK